MLLDGGKAIESYDLTREDISAVRRSGEQLALPSRLQQGRRPADFVRDPAWLGVYPRKVREHP